MAEGVVEHEATRRRFVNWFLGSSAGAFLAAVLYPVSRYLIPPPVEESTAKSVTLPMKPADVKPNSGQIFKFGTSTARCSIAPTSIISGARATTDTTT
jgi:hypothetical protein